MILHDYNLVNELKGVKKAVKDYEKELGEKLVKIPIPDICGSLIIGK